MSEQGSKDNDKVKRLEIMVEEEPEVKHVDIHIVNINSDEPKEDIKSHNPLLNSNGIYSGDSNPSSGRHRDKKVSFKLKKEHNQSKEYLEIIKKRKYDKEFFEKRMKKPIGVTTLIGPKRENTIMKFQDPGSGEVGSNPFERSRSLDFSDQIADMDILLYNMDRNTSLKTKLEKAIIEFNQNPNKAFDYLWKEQIVF